MMTDASSIPLRGAHVAQGQGLESSGSTTPRYGPAVRQHRARRYSLELHVVVKSQRLEPQGRGMSLRLQVRG